MLQAWRERLVLVLFAALPFHALGVTVLTRLLDGPNQPPLAALALWKEALLVLVLILAVVEIARSGLFAIPRMDTLDWCVSALAAALLVASLIGEGSPRQVAYGIRYDLVPLAAFVVLRRLPWSDLFRRLAPRVLAWAAIAAASYALLTLFLPDAAFRLLGYSDLHSLYVPGRPIAAFQQIGGTALRRVQGPMSGPNQFGIWMAVVLPFVLTLGPRFRRVAAPLLLSAIVLSFSRAAWIATAAIVVVSLWPQLRRLSVTAVTTLCIGVLAISVSVLIFFPSVILRVESSIDHLHNPLAAGGIMLREPLGRGLGSAGPANNRVADACVFLEEGGDASWASPHHDLCVFVGDTQIQPAGRDCQCPLLPENWYLQLGVEGGWLAFAAFIALIVLTLRRLRAERSPVFLSLLAVAIAGLFLHAWEDAAVAYTAWILCAVTLTFSRVPRASTGT